MKHVYRYITAIRRQKKMNEEEIRGVLGKVMHPEINASLIDLGIIKDIIV